MKPFPLIFAGTAAIGVPLLRALTADPRFEVTLVLSQPDKPAGRKLELTPAPVKAAAKALGLPVFQPADVNSEGSLKTLASVPAKAMLTMAFGQLFKKPLLALFPHGCLNVHASLLPLHRGASPIQSAILAGDAETGVSLMRMEAAMDSGPVYARFRSPLGGDENAVHVHERLAALAAETIPDALVEALSGKLLPATQEDSRATYCHRILKEDGELSWSLPAEAIDRRVRAFAGWPGAHTHWNGLRLKVLKGQPQVSEKAFDKPGTVMVQGGAVFVACGRGKYELLSVQPEGGKPQAAHAFLNGRPAFAQARLERYNDRKI